MADLDFWKAPSRRFYLAKQSEFGQLQQQLQRKRLSLRKRKAAPIDDQDSDRIENAMDTVSRYIFMEITGND